MINESNGDIIARDMEDRNTSDIKRNKIIQDMDELEKNIDIQNQDVEAWVEIVEEVKTMLTKDEGILLRLETERDKMVDKLQKLQYQIDNPETINDYE